MGSARYWDGDRFAHDKETVSTNYCSHHSDLRPVGLPSDGGGGIPGA